MKSSVKSSTYSFIYVFICYFQHLTKYQVLDNIEYIE